MAKLQIDTSRPDKTSKQEQGTLWVFKRALADNVVYHSSEDILKDPKFSELKKIYPLVDEEWLDGYWKQNQAIHKKYEGTDFSEFTRDGGFMDYTTKLVEKRFGISKKDTWDPADVWLTKDEHKIIATIERRVVKDPTATIDKLNAMLRTYFKSKRVVGISLKKISGDHAKLVEVNTRGIQFKENSEEFNFNVTSMKCGFDVTTKSEGRKKGAIFNTKEASIEADGRDHRQKVVLIYRIGGVGNMVIQPRFKGNQAQLGSAPVEMMEALYKDRKWDFTNKNAAFPKSATEFQSKTYLAKAIKMFNGIKAAGVETKVTTAKEFINNMTAAFEMDPKLATLKLMHLTFFYELTKKGKKETNDIVTEIAFMAQKKERGTYAWGFGPFGKMY